MAWLDVRPEGKAGGCLGSKFVSILTGIFQLVIWVIAFINVVFQPGDMKRVYSNYDTANLVVSGLLVSVLIAFSVVLLVGIFQHRENLIKMYLISNIVMISLFVLSFFTNLFTNPKEFGWSGFISTILVIVMNVLFYFIIRNHYLLTYKRRVNERNGLGQHV